MIFDAVVIGKGLMGTAVTRYLSMAGLATAVIGPDEPENMASHPGVFASHYDQGRITRQLSKDEVWSALAMQAITQYPNLQEKSGIQFHEPRGGLYVSNPAQDAAYWQKLSHCAQRFNIPYETFSVAQTAERFPFLAFPEQFQVIYEPAPAGYINPRDLIQAQLTIAAQHKAAIIRETAVQVIPKNGIFSVQTDAGRMVAAKNVLIAAGAYSNCFELLPQKLDLKVKTETIILAELSEAEAARLQTMPTVIYQVEAADIDTIYLLPPIRYANGRFIIKMGCNTRADIFLKDEPAMQHWMVSGNSDVVFAQMKQALLAILPNLAADTFYTKRCLVTYTPHGKPFIDQIAEGLFVATGGNGSSAKCSDTIGKLAASLITQEAWPSIFTRSSFKAEFA